MVEFGIKNFEFCKNFDIYVFENKRKPNDRVGPVVPKIYKESVKAARRPYFMSFSSSRAYCQLDGKWAR